MDTPRTDNERVSLVSHGQFRFKTIKVGGWEREGRGEWGEALINQAVFVLQTT